MMYDMVLGVDRFELLTQLLFHLYRQPHSKTPKKQRRPKTEKKVVWKAKRLKQMAAVCFAVPQHENE